MPEDIPVRPIEGKPSKIQELKEKLKKALSQRDKKEVSGQKIVPDEPMKG